MKLIITEKPSVAKSIASALGVTSRADGYFEGGGWLVSWCIGHLVGLADAAAYDDRYKKWRYEDLPILPDPFCYVVSEEKAAQFHILRSLMDRSDVTELRKVQREEKEYDTLRQNVDSLLERSDEQNQEHRREHITGLE